MNAYPCRPHALGRAIAFIPLLLLVSLPLHGQLLTVTFNDQDLDSLGPIDLTHFRLTFDPESGEYEVVFESARGAWFEDGFLLGVNLFNGDLGTSSLDPSYFHSNLEVKGQDCPSPFIRWTGFEPRLRAWSVGDRIAASGPEPLGLPAGFSVFNTGLASPLDPSVADDLVGDGVIGFVEDVESYAAYRVPPTARDDRFEIDEDTPRAWYDILGNDCSPDLSAGTLVLEEILSTDFIGEAELRDQGLSYRAPSDFFGDVTLVYSVSDLEGQRDTAEVTFSIKPVNDPPIAVDDEFRLNLRGTVHWLNVLANDSSGPDQGESLSIEILDADARLGMVHVVDGLIHLDSVGRFVGDALISYRLHDGNGGSSDAIASVIVDSPNVDPIAIDDLFSMLEDGVADFDVLANDLTSPDERETLSITEIGKTHQGAQVSVVNDMIRYLPPDNFYGADVFSYQISDGYGGNSQATVQVTVENVNDPPQVNRDEFDMVGDGFSYFFEPLQNDDHFPDPPEYFHLSEVVFASEMASIEIDGQRIRVDVDPFYVGDLDFEYWVTDESGAKSSVISTIRVNAANYPPIALADAVQISDEVESVSIEVLANDSTAPDEGEMLEIISITNSGSPGSVITHDGRKILFQPGEAFESGWFRYVVSDGNGGEDSAVVIVTANAVRVTPAVNDDFRSVKEDEVSFLDVIGNDFLAEEFLAATSFEIINGPLNGEAFFSDNLLVQYRPDADYFGRDSVHYLVTYPSGTSSVAELVIEVENVNDRPVAMDDRFEMLEDGGVISLAVLENDQSGPDDPELLEIVGYSSPTNGGLVTEERGRLFYRPLDNFSGVDRFTYSIRDQGGETAVASVEIHVSPVNDPPLAVFDEVFLEGRSDAITIDVLKNDSAGPDIDEVLTVIAVTQGDFGGKVELLDKRIRYHRPSVSASVDQFTYSISDGNGGTSDATVRVNIESPVSGTRGEGDVFEMEEDAVGVILDVLANDFLQSSVDRSAIGLSVEDFEGNGDLVVRDQVLLFSPAPDYFGRVSFNYRIQYLDWQSAAIPVTVNVMPVNDPPLLSDDVFRFENPPAEVILDVLANDSIGVDIGEQLTLVSHDALAEGGQILLRDNTLYYVAEPAFEGELVFGYQVSDGNGSEVAAKVYLSITRRDVFPPVVVCRDFETTLPASGFLNIAASDVDGGSYDDEGSLSLSVIPNRLDESDMGPNLVELRGVDEAGNEAICVATITLLPRRDLSVQLVHPEPRTVFRVLEDYGFSAADVPVRVSHSNAVDSIEIYGDGEQLVVLDTRRSGGNVAWLWEEVPWGDHELRVVGLGEDGQSIDSLSVRLSVSDLASDVALVIPEGYRSEALELVRNYLFEVGVNVDVFLNVLEGDFVETEWDMVIQYETEPGDISEASISAYETLASSGVGLYFIGNSLLDIADLSKELRARWVRLMLFDRQETIPLGGFVDPFIDPGEATLEGRFGKVEPFQMSGFSNGELVDPFANSLVQKDGADLVALVDRSFIPPLGIVGRRYVQLFPVRNENSQSALKTLFQNATCWVLPDCFECENANLPPDFRSARPHPVLGEMFSVELYLVNNGECEITGAVAGVAGAGLEVISLRVDGREIDVTPSSEGDGFFGLVGRLGKGSDAAVTLEWELRTLNPEIREIEFETRSNNTKSDIRSLPIQVASVSLFTGNNGALRLRVEGEESGLYDIEYATDMEEPVRWQIFRKSIAVDTKGQAEFDVVPQKGARFFRLRSQTPS